APSQVAGQRAGLDASEDRHADAWDEDRPPADPIVGVGAESVPRFQVEPSVALVALPLERSEKPSQLVAKQEQPVRIFSQQLPELFDRGVIDDIAPNRGRLHQVALRGFLRKPAQLGIGSALLSSGLFQFSLRSISLQLRNELILPKLRQRLRVPV